MSRKEDIRAAAIELFAANGFQATSTADVAKRAGVSEGTVFYHFQTKEGILLSLFDELFDDYVGGIGQILQHAPSGLAAIESYVSHHLRRVRDKSQEAMLLMRDLPFSARGEGSPSRKRILARIGELDALIVQAIEMGQADGSIRPCDARQNALLLRGLLKGLGNLMLLEQYEVADTADALREFCRRALAAQV